MSRSYLDAIRNPQPYSESEFSNPPSRSRTPVPTYEHTYPKSSNPPSRSRTPNSILELTNPKPYPRADNAIVKPTPVKATPAKGDPYQDGDKPKAKKYTKTKNTPRSTPVPSDGEVKFTTPRSGSLSSMDLALRVVDPEPIKAGSGVNVEALPKPGPRSTSIDAKKPLSQNGDKQPVNDDDVDTMAVKITTTRSSHPLTAGERREKQKKAAGEGKDGDEKEVWYKRNEKFIWIICLVFLLVVIFFALGLGLGLQGSGSGYSSGAFARTFGQDCRFSCRNKAKYTNRQQSPLILIAIDGLPSDIESSSENLARNIKRLSECGAHARMVFPAFTSETYPNLWTIITGRYPESHGVMSDYIRSGGQVFDPRQSQSNLKDPEWYRAKPLWMTAREQGVITASHSWLGNDVNDKENDEGQTLNGRPNYYQSYNSRRTPHAMMKTVRDWIDQEDVAKIPQFITVFFNSLGEATRQYGNNSNEANKALKEIDDAIGILLDSLLAKQNALCFNFVVVAPTGLMSTSCGNDNANVQFLTDHVLNLIGLEMTPDFLNAFARITVSSSADDMYNTNEEFSKFLKCKFSEAGSVYTRSELPSRLHFSSPNVPDDVFVLMKSGKSFGFDSRDYSDQYCQYASNGYDSSSMGMMGMFVGFGPDFKTGYSMGEFFNVDIYNLLAKLIGVTPEANNGTQGSLHGMLKSPGPFPTTTLDRATVPSCPYSSSRALADYKTGCTCPGSSPPIEDRIASVLSAASSSATGHIPFGTPELLAFVTPDNGSSCKLYQSSYVTVYDKTLTIAKYVSLTLTAGFSLAPSPSGCILTDTRLGVGEGPKCLTYTDPETSVTIPEGVKQSFLLQPELSVGKADAGIITSNIVPMYSTFQSGIWGPLKNTYQTWAGLGNSFDINVVQGPVYDTNYDGVADEFSLLAMSSSWAGPTVVPSHFFVVVTRCTNRRAIATCVPEDIQIMTFILPHNNLELPCQTSLDDYLMNYQASVQDVERMTGLCFFPEWSLSDDATKMRTITLMKARMAEGLWTN